MRKHIVGLLAVLIVGAGIIRAATIHVDGDTCPLVGSGTVADPYCDIQFAIDVAFPSDVVKVAAGTYTTKHSHDLPPEVPIFPKPADVIVFMRDQVHVEGAGAGQSILDAGGSDRVVMFFQVGPETRFEGFTVTGGFLDRVGDGGGMLVVFSSPRISQNHIVGNRAFFGGGIEVLYYSSPVIENNLIEKNQAGSQTSSIAVGAGGGIDVAFDSSPIISSNNIIGNYSFGLGGGLSFYDTDAFVDSNRIEGNVADGNGGGVYSVPRASPGNRTVALRSNIISMNVVLEEENSGARDGGGAFVGEGTDLSTNTISHNRAIFGDGGGVYAFGPAAVSLSDNLIFGNGAVFGGGVFVDPLFNNPQFSNNDAFANLPTNYDGTSDPTGTQGNFSEDPILRNVPDFVAPVERDRFQTLVFPLDEEPTRQFAIGDTVEYGNDGIRRIVTDILTAAGIPLVKLETDPAVTDEEMQLFPVALRRWGANGDLKEDFGTEILSPLVDATNTSNAPPTDAAGRVRRFDGDLRGQTQVDIGAVENVAELPLLDNTAEGGLMWEMFIGLPWHYHLYRGTVSGLRDVNEDGFPDGPDNVPGTADDGYGDCLAPGVDLPGPDFFDTDVPPIGEAFFYLANVADVGEGILGFDSAGRIRQLLRPCD